ncbi:MAG: hypothetical protein JO330_06075 [Mycobacteriaceae bacterium]|nr:hypothetical protein [Mycobacteriaceae bacterium]
MDSKNLKIDTTAAAAQMNVIAGHGEQAAASTARGAKAPNGQYFAGFGSAVAARLANIAAMVATSTEHGREAAATTISGIEGTEQQNASELGPSSTITA